MNNSTNIVELCNSKIDLSKLAAILPASIALKEQIDQYTDAPWILEHTRDVFISFEGKYIRIAKSDNGKCSLMSKQLFKKAKIQEQPEQPPTLLPEHREFPNQRRNSWQDRSRPNFNQAGYRRYS
jgi:hypothetical protein